MNKHDFQTEREKWAWLAGVIDGEGYIGITKRRDPRYRKGYQWNVTLTVANNNLCFLDQVKKVCKYGTIHDCASPKGKGYTKGAHWYRFTLISTNPDKIKRILEKVIFFLIVKREKAELVLGLDGSNWEACYQEMMTHRTTKGRRRRYHEIYQDHAPMIGKS